MYNLKLIFNDGKEYFAKDGCMGLFACASGAKESFAFCDPTDVLTAICLTEGRDFADQPCHVSILDAKEQREVVRLEANLAGSPEVFAENLKKMAAFLEPMNFRVTHDGGMKDRPGSLVMAEAQERLAFTFGSMPASPAAATPTGNINPGITR